MRPASAGASPPARPRALLIAAVTLYVPCLAPIVLGMLRDCSHCMQSYLELLVIVPGVIAPTLLHLQGAWFGAAAAALTLAALGLLYVAARRLPRGALHALQVVCILCVGLEAVALAYALRA